jgi:hypothetical protein
MSFPSPTLFRAMSAEYDAPAGATVEVWTDLPAPGGWREALALPPSQGIAVAGPVAMRDTTKGTQVDLRVTAPAGAGVAVLRLAFRVRKIGRTPTDWVWWQAPLISGASDELVTLRVPVPPTPEGLVGMDVPVPPTPEGLAEMDVPVPPTVENAEMKVPVPPTAEGLLTQRVEVPPSPEAEMWADFPMDE